MKKTILSLSLVFLCLLAFSQARYDGALERFRMKSDESVSDGLVGEYYSGMNFEKLVAIRQDRELYFDWDYSNPIAELGADYFSIRWRGKIYAPKEGKYVITAYTDDGMRIWLNGRLIINAWKDQPPTLYESRVILEGDAFYDIRIDYYQERYQTTAAVFFNPEGESRLPLNSNNSVFGENLSPSQSKFDFWEERSLIDRFKVWLGMEEEPVAKPFRDQSYRPEPKIVKALIPSREEEQAGNESQVEKTELRIPKNIEKPNVSNERVEELPIRKVETIENKFDKMLPGETLIVENINFDRGKSKLREESYPELEKLYIALERHPEWKIKIDGHTDNVGYAALNLELSYDRARTVYFYLIRRGIDKQRLRYEGFGSSKPLFRNDTEANKQKNRRVEVSLINNSLVKSD